MPDQPGVSFDPAQLLPVWDTTALFPEGKGAVDAARLGPAAHAFLDRQQAALSQLGSRMLRAAQGGDGVALLRALDEGRYLESEVQRVDVYCHMLHAQHPQDQGLSALHEQVGKRATELAHLHATQELPLLQWPVMQRRALLQAVPALRDYQSKIAPEDISGPRIPLSHEAIALRKREVGHLRAALIAEYDAAHLGGPVPITDAPRLAACAGAYNKTIRAAFLDAEAHGFPDPLNYAASEHRLPPEGMLRWWERAPESAEAATQRMEKLIAAKPDPALAERMHYVLHPPHRYEWSEARSLITEALCEFNPAFKPILDRAFTEGWIQARPVGPVLAGGATYMNVSAAMMPEGSKAAHPYVHSEFHYTERDLVRLAHELGGHCLATQMANEQRVVNHDTDTALHETFALFAQRLVVDKMLQHADGADHRATILRTLAYDSFINLYETTARCRFQRATFEAARQPDGSLRELGAEELTGLYKQYGRTAELGAQRTDPNGPAQWAANYHLFTQSAYYNDSYREAIMAAGALYNRWEASRGEARSALAQGWTRVMEAGGTIRFPQAMAQMGIDVTSPDFLTQGVENVMRTIAHAESAMAAFGEVGSAPPLPSTPKVAPVMPAPDMPAAVPAMLAGPRILPALSMPAPEPASFWQRAQAWVTDTLGMGTKTPPPSAPLLPASPAMVAVSPAALPEAAIAQDAPGPDTHWQNRTRASQSHASGEHRSCPSWV